MRAEMGWRVGVGVAFESARVSVASVDRRRHGGSLGCEATHNGAV